jgi:hypothetical protein
MESSTLFAVSRHFKVQAAAILSIADNLIEKEIVGSESYENHAFADKSMAGDLAIRTDPCIFLNFDKRTDFRIIANFTTIQVDKVEDFYILP